MYSPACRTSSEPVPRPRMSSEARNAMCLAICVVSGAAGNASKPETFLADFDESLFCCPEGIQAVSAKQVLRKRIRIYMWLVLPTKIELSLETWLPPGQFRGIQFLGISYISIKSDFYGKRR